MKPRWDGEERARLTDAAQVHRRQEQHHDDRDTASWPETMGIADAAFWAPEEIDTATVRT